MIGVGELVVKRVHGHAVVERADRFIYADRDFIAELRPDGDGVWRAADVAYRVVGPSVSHPSAMLCERVA